VGSGYQAINGPLTPNREGKMRVIFNPTKTEKGSGTTSTAAWDNRDMSEAMKVLFGIRQDEEIYQLEVTREGITARIRHKTQARFQPF